jgi:hypothetical protein
MSYSIYVIFHRFLTVPHNLHSFSRKSSTIKHDLRVSLVGQLPFLMGM